MPVVHLPHGSTSIVTTDHVTYDSSSQLPKVKSMSSRRSFYHQLVMCFLSYSPTRVCAVPCKISCTLCSCDGNHNSVYSLSSHI